MEGLVVALVTCEKAEQPVPKHCSMRYPVTPTLSVEASQLSVIATPEAELAVSDVGAVGGCVSLPPPPPPAAGVVALTALE